MVWALKTLRPYLNNEWFTVYTYHATFHCILTIDDAFGRLIRWRLRFAEIDFGVKYKKGHANSQVNALSRLHAMSETISHDSNDDIPVFDLQIVNVELELNKTKDDTDLIDSQYAEIDEAYVAMDDQASPSFTIEPIGIDKGIQKHMHDQYCAEILQNINQAGSCKLKSTIMESYSRLGTKESKSFHHIPWMTVPFTSFTTSLQPINRVAVKSTIEYASISNGDT